MRIEPVQGDVAHYEGDERPEVAEGARELGPVVLVPAESHDQSAKTETFIC